MASGKNQIRYKYLQQCFLNELLICNEIVGNFIYFVWFIKLYFTALLHLCLKFKSGTEHQELVKLNFLTKLLCEAVSIILRFFPLIFVDLWK